MVSGILIEREDGIVMVLGLKPWLWAWRGVMYFYQLSFNIKSMSPKIKIILIFHIILGFGHILQAVFCGCLLLFTPLLESDFYFVT